MSFHNRCTNLTFRFATSFATRTRPNGQEFHDLCDTAADWMRDAIQKAHNWGTYQSFPEDHIYTLCAQAVDAIWDSLHDVSLDEITCIEGLGDAREAFSDMAPARLSDYQIKLWFAECSFADDYVLEAQSEYGTENLHIMGQLRQGFMCMARDIFDTMARAICDQAEAELEGVEA